LQNRTSFGNSDGIASLQEFKAFVNPFLKDRPGFPRVSRVHLDVDYGGPSVFAFISRAGYPARVLDTALLDRSNLPARLDFPTAKGKPAEERYACAMQT
jgi:hypothetical protein